jgi:hypothetical protein
LLVSILEGDYSASKIVQIKLLLNAGDVAIADCGWPGFDLAHLPAKQGSLQPEPFMDLGSLAAPLSD